MKLYQILLVEALVILSINSLRLLSEDPREKRKRFISNTVNNGDIKKSDFRKFCSIPLNLIDVQYNEGLESRVDLDFKTGYEISDSLISSSPAICFYEGGTLTKYSTLFMFDSENSYLHWWLENVPTPKCNVDIADIIVDYEPPKKYEPPHNIIIVMFASRKKRTEEELDELRENFIERENFSITDVCEKYGTPTAYTYFRAV